eukprot:4713499-Prymnesium_polylepis.1
MARQLARSCAHGATARKPGMHCRSLCTMCPASTPQHCFHPRRSRQPPAPPAQLMLSPTRSARHRSR